MAALETGKHAIRPRRLGHVNLYVGNIEAAMQFYVNVCGIEEVFRERKIKAGFVSNGRGHHDLGMVELAPRKLIGRDGEVLGDREVPSKPGLNHLAFEIDTEAELVDFYHKIKNAPDAKIDMVLDHGLAKSVYVIDPGGSELEFYADSIHDWRSFWNEALAKNAIVTGLWEPGASPASKTNYYDENPEIRAVNDAPLHPVSVLHATMVTPNYEATRQFYLKTGGFEELPLGRTDLTAFRGHRQNLHDVVLVAAEPGEERHLHHVTFRMAKVQDLEAGETRVQKSGLKIERRLDTDRKKSLFVRDPDGLLLEFAFYKSTAIPDLAKLSKQEAAYLL
jgi:catechol 2,3-dioxygenase